MYMEAFTGSKTGRILLVIYITVCRIISIWSNISFHQFTQLIPSSKQVTYLTSLACTRGMSHDRRAICPRKAGGKCESNWATSSLSHRLQGPARRTQLGRRWWEEKLRKADASHIAFSSKQILVRALLIAVSPLRLLHLSTFPISVSLVPCIHYLIIAFMISLSGQDEPIFLVELCPEFFSNKMVRKIVDLTFNCQPQNKLVIYVLTLYWMSADKSNICS